MPRVSVVIPTYDRADRVQEAVDSVLAQTYRDFEIVVVDDGSTDETGRALARYGDRIRYLWQHNRGAGAARNAGIAASGGELIAFLDSDDLYLPQRLEVAVAVLDAHPSFGANYVDARILDASGRLWVRSHLERCGSAPSGWIFDALLRRQLLTCNTVTVRREAMARSGCFGEECFSGEDTRFFWRLARVCQIIALPQVLVVGRETRGSRSDFRQGRERHTELLAEWARGEEGFLRTWDDLSGRQKTRLARRIWGLHHQRAGLLSKLGREGEAHAAARQANAMAREFGLFLPGARAMLSKLVPLVHRLPLFSWRPPGAKAATP